MEVAKKKQMNELPFLVLTFECYEFNFGSPLAEVKIKLQLEFLITSGNSLNTRMCYTSYTFSLPRPTFLNVNIP